MNITSKPNFASMTINAPPHLDARPARAVDAVTRAAPSAAHQQGHFLGVKPNAANGANHSVGLLVKPNLSSVLNGIEPFKPSVASMLKGIEPVKPSLASVLSGIEPVKPSVASMLSGIQPFTVAPKPAATGVSAASTLKARLLPTEKTDPARMAAGRELFSKLRVESSMKFVLNPSALAPFGGLRLELPAPLTNTAGKADSIFDLSTPSTGK